MTTQRPDHLRAAPAADQSGTGPERRPERIADLHIHSHYSRATSKDLDFEHLAQWAQLKGVHIVGTGDIAHPGWLQAMRDKLEPAEDGLLRLKPDLAAAVAAEVPAACRAEVRFLLAGEISNIYKRPDPYTRTQNEGRSDVRKVHNLIFAPALEVVEAIQIALEQIGNIRADGRPILGLDSRDLLELVLSADERCALIPAHIWTPWFSMLGSKSGFDTVESCFGDLAGHIFALETGLSSDPPMNWRVSNLDGYTLVSNSDAHSPPKLAREATIFHCELSYSAIFAALRSGDPALFGGTLEFFPEEGKYHNDGHRKCGVCWSPLETLAHSGTCPACGKPVTVGVSHRVERLADRPPGGKPARTHPYTSLIPLPEILAEVHGVGPQSRRVQRDYHRLLDQLGPELVILRHVPLEDIQRAGGELLAQGIARMRRGHVLARGGYDGEYGVVKVLAPELGEPADAAPQLGLFGELQVELHAEAAPEPNADAATEPDTELDTVPDTESATVPQPPRGPDVSQTSDAAADDDGVDDDGVDDDGWQPLPLFDAPIGAAEDDATPTSISRRDLPNPAPAHADGAATAEDTEPEPWAQLNAEQAAAVQCTHCHLLIVAGPGTGKTHTLTTRIAYLIQARQAAPESILAITFTNKAADELAARVGKRVGNTLARRIPVQTFHALGADLLRTYGEALAGLGVELPPTFGPTFGIADETQQALLLALAAPELGTRARAQLLARISDLKNRLESPDPAVDPELARCFAAYEAQLRANALVDYDDLIALSVRLLEEVPAVRAALHDRYRWISVDEYQDVNAAQVRLLRGLAGPQTNVCAIGDPDQAIYGFRGADYRHFFAFEQDFPAAKVFTLQRNYRSPQSLLRAARQVIAKNPDRMAVELWSDFAQNIQLDVYTAATAPAEAETIVHRIEQMVGGTSHFSLDSGRVANGATRLETGAQSGEPVAQAEPASIQDYSFGDFAVLFRLHAQAEPLVEALERSGIPYQVVGGPSPYAHADMRWLLAALQWTQTPQSQATLLQLCAWDAAPAELVQLQAALTPALEKACVPGCDPRDVLAQLTAAAQVVPGAPAARLGARAQKLARFWPHFMAQPADAPPEAQELPLLTDALERLHAFLAEHAAEFPPLDGARFVALQTRAASFGRRWSQFLDALALTRPADAYDPRADRVTLMTLHAAKGLEFPVVFLAGCEEGLLPYLPATEANRGDVGEGADAGEAEECLLASVDDVARIEAARIETARIEEERIEEERRLFYVGMTRAQARLILTHAQRRRRFGQTTTPALSRFVDDIEATLKAVQQMAPRPVPKPRPEDQQLPLF